jgi:hypothetical protein
LVPGLSYEDLAALDIRSCWNHPDVIKAYGEQEVWKTTLKWSNPICGEKRDDNRRVETDSRGATEIPSKIIMMKADWSSKLLIFCIVSCIFILIMATALDTEDEEETEVKLEAFKIF